ncbi:MAG: Gfo/Idh/MocA family oxidoreductase, partial [Pirellulales bacterium]|nr:Gfo/Idh/MocA family oxidoreductase [Pirellulales bacterium]
MQQDTTVFRKSFSRRTFLQSTVAAFAAPVVVPSSVLGANSPNERINVGVIGTGNQSRIDLPSFLNKDDVQVNAVCDVNTGSYGYAHKDHFLGREPAKKLVDKFYADKTGSGSYKGCAAYNDFRKIIDRSDIDVVVIIVPDHWHALMTIMAAKAGKDIYCEKPLSLTIDHGKRMVAAVRKHKRILQTGSHFRSGPSNRFGCELVLNGRIGKLKRIRTSLAPNNKVGPGPGWKPMPVPEGFDYETWIGPAPMVPYHKDRCLYRFRFNLDYSGGQMTNFGAHSNDIAQLGNGTSLTGPIEYEPVKVVWPPKGSLFTTAEFSHFRARYANGVLLECKTDEKWQGTRFEGTEGWVQFDFGGLHTHPKSLATSKIGPNEIHLPKSYEGQEKDVYRNYIPDHVRNFLDSVKSRKDPIEPVEIGHRTATICHSGNICLQLNRKLK